MDRILDENVIHSFDVVSFALNGYSIALCLSGWRHGELGGYGVESLKRF